MRNMLNPPDETLLFGRTNDNVELLKAWAGTSVAFAIAQVGIRNLASSTFVEYLLISAIVCGLGFVFHELAHRVVARSYNAEAHFVANDRWLILSALIALTGFFVAAPGAVWHRGYLTPRQGGLIALAGPATNLGLALVFLVLYPILYLTGFQSEWFLLLCVIGVGLNSWLGLFNMIPAGPFDGAKVLAWNTVVFGVTVAIGIALTFFIGSPRTLISIWTAVLTTIGA